MNARKAIDGKALIYMIGLCAIWGMQQTAVKLAAPAMPEILQVALRADSDHRAHVFRSDAAQRSDLIARRWII